MWKNAYWVVWFLSLKERDHLEDHGVGGRILNRVSKKRRGRHGLDCLIWLSIGTSGRLM
jgi:hypothetical protein